MYGLTSANNASSSDSVRKSSTTSMSCRKLCLSVVGQACWKWIFLGTDAFCGNDDWLVGTILLWDANSEATSLIQYLKNILVNQILRLVWNLNSNSLWKFRHKVRQFDDLTIILDRLNNNNDQNMRKSFRFRVVINRIAKHMYQAALPILNYINSFFRNV